MAFEQNQKIEIEDVKTELGKKVNTPSVLTLEEIQATTNLTGKVAGADNIKTLTRNRIFNIKCFWSDSTDKDYVEFRNVPIGYREAAFVAGNANNHPFFRYCALFMNGGAADSNEQSINSGSISSKDNGNGTANIYIYFSC